MQYIFLHFKIFLSGLSIACKFAVAQLKH